MSRNAAVADKAVESFMAAADDAVLLIDMM